MATGGAESLVVEMVRRSGDVGWQCAVASHGGRRVDDLVEAGVPHFDIPHPRRTLRGLISARKATARVVKQFRPDIVIAHNVSATIVTRLARPKVPVLTIFQGVTASDYRNAARILNFTSDRVVTVSDAIGRRLLRAGLRGMNVMTIRNAVTPPVLRSRSQARAELNIPPTAPVALCLARMERQKRHDLLLDAWHKLSGDEILLLAGDGSQRPKLERQALALTDRVRFLGDRSDVPVLLAAADITVLISDWEGLPIAVLESLAAGRPVVASDVDGVGEILRDGGGTCVPPGDVDAIAAALRDMLHDGTARRRAAHIGLSTIANSYDAPRMMAQYQDVVSEMLAEAEPS
jgi:glycosyltransferase involved in cell wall biosynthesis